MQVAALKQLLFAGPCIPPQMLVQNDHPMQTFQLFNIETNVQEYNLYLVVNEQWDSEHLHLHLYLHLASWQYACAQHNVHLTLVFSLTLGKLALMLALALGSAHRRYAHRHLALASALILALGRAHGQVNGSRFGTYSLPLLATIFTSTSYSPDLLLKNIALAIVLKIDD